MTGNAAVVNFSGGETSPRSRGRFDQPWYQTSAKKMLNFIADIQGPARFRPGYVYSFQTRQGQAARIISFQGSDLVAWLLEFTPGYMRVRNPVTYALQTGVQGAITGITLAAQAVVTVSSITGIANGNEVVLSGMVAMPQLNNKQFVVANVSGSTFNLTDPVTGAYLNTSAFAAAETAGVAAVVYEITTIFGALDLPSLQAANSAAVMYLVSGTQPEQELSPNGAGTFTIGAPSYTDSPFATVVGPISLVTFGVALSNTPTYGNPGKTYINVGSAGGAFGLSAQVNFANVGGTTQLNTGTYLLVYAGRVPQPGVYEVQTAGGESIDSTAWGTWTSGGTITSLAEFPLSVTFYEGRRVIGGTNLRPDCIFLSMSPDPSTGDSQYDTFTGGSGATNACFFQFAPTGGSTSCISWVRGGPDYLFAGTFGGPFRVSGSGLDIPITPSSINVRQFDTAGAEATVPAGLQEMFFIQRAGVSLRSIKVVNPYLATFESADLCLNAEQIAYSPLQRVALQRGRPDTLWAFRADGVLAGMSVKLTQTTAEVLTGWHRHQLGGAGQVIDSAIIQRQTGFDQLFCVVQRTIAGATRCYVEVMADDVVFPDQEDFYGTGANEAADLLNWQNAVYRLQSNYVHLDAELAYDGSLRGVAAAATLTPSAVGVPQVEGQAPTTITLTASQSVFLASDVGSEIWIKPNLLTGVGAGRALITAYNSGTSVTATVSVPFSSATAFAAGDWFFAVSTFYGFGHLEGSVVAAVGDGAVISDGGTTGDPSYPVLTVTNGTIVIPAGDLGQQQRAAVFRAGLPYVGLLETHNLEMGGRNGPAQSKPRNISEINIRFMASLGVEYGTDLYNMEQVNHRLSDATYDRPTPPFSGVKRLKLEDAWAGLNDFQREKNVFITQSLPLPAIVQFLDLSYETSDADVPPGEG